MPTKLVFDLDLTLYSENDYIDTDNESLYYNSFKKKPFLNQLLSIIPYKKYILTNASYSHAEDVMKRIGIKQHFQKIISSDMGEIYKPDLPIYVKAINNFMIEPTDTIYFFEDQIDNLKTAKERFKWNTILITREKIRKPKYVDYIFHSIEEALLFLIVKDDLGKQSKYLKTPPAKKRSPTRRRSSKKNSVIKKTIIENTIASAPIFNRNLPDNMYAIHNKTTNIITDTTQVNIDSSNIKNENPSINT